MKKSSKVVQGLGAVHRSPDSNRHWIKQGGNVSANLIPTRIPDVLIIEPKIFGGRARPCGFAIRRLRQPTKILRHQLAQHQGHQAIERKASKQKICKRRRTANPTQRIFSGNVNRLEGAARKNVEFTPWWPSDAAAPKLPSPPAPNHIDYLEAELLPNGHDDGYDDPPAAAAD